MSSIRLFQSDSAATPAMISAAVGFWFAILVLVLANVRYVSGELPELALLHPDGYFRGHPVS
jgi:hypothetical protein